MTIEEEIKLLERKLELMKQIKEVQDAMDKITKDQPRYVPYPVYPEPYYPGRRWIEPYYTLTTSGDTLEVNN